MLGYLNKKSLLETHNQIVEDWNFIKTKNFTPHDVSADSHRRVWWKCDLGHEEFNPVRVRVRTNGCSQCARSKREKNLQQKELEREQNRKLRFGTIQDLKNNPSLSLREIFELAENFEFKFDLEELLTPVTHSFEKRMYLCLKRHRITTIEHLMNINYMELTQIKLFGTESQNRLYQLLKERFLRDN